MKRVWQRGYPRTSTAGRNSMRILIATSPRDLRYCRICLASVRRFHPDSDVSLLPGGPLPRSFLREVALHFGVKVHPVPPGDYGWGFVKLEPLFDPPGDPFLVLDADTVLTGPLPDTIDARLSSPGAPAFLVDEEDQPESEMRRLYYDWDRAREVDPAATRPAFVFNSGQWVGTPGILKREDFEPWVEWGFPRRLKHPELFMPGDQGIINYVLNQSFATGRFRVDRLPLMRWPGHGMEEFSAAAVAAGSAPARVIHWAGMKHPRLRDMEGADLLGHFERIYYARIPCGRILRPLRAIRTFLGEFCHRLTTRLRLFWNAKVKRL